MDVHFFPWDIHTYFSFLDSWTRMSLRSFFFFFYDLLFCLIWLSDLICFCVFFGFYLFLFCLFGCSTSLSIMGVHNGWDILYLMSFFFLRFYIHLTCSWLINFGYLYAWFQGLLSSFLFSPAQSIIIFLMFSEVVVIAHTMISSNTVDNWSQLGISLFLRKRSSK